ncbi:MAG: prephenate dehydrogenase/arogenate dehydrogenase family protein [Anaerovoracaceae bacterium]|jgi:prephenate dehydrogenase|nr:prephenate dehydrogenase/arogenate dehydrogenase family protein [Anaerovoracaceae bacterium]
MNIGIVGLGLIGGSLAKSIRKNTQHSVWGLDQDPTVLAKAKMVGAIDKELRTQDFEKCDLLIIAIYPKDVLKFLRENASSFNPKGLVMDCCGVKEEICRDAFPLAKENGFTFVGGHPMAGIEFSGFDASTISLFQKASMIFTPLPDIQIAQLEWLKDLFLSIGFSHIEISTPEKHDEIIALSSQLAHVVSSAYIQSPSAMNHAGFSAGSFHDMTRVAELNETLWSELFFANRDNLVREVDGLIDRLKGYSQALKNEDEDHLYSLLHQGRIRRLELK